MSAAAEARYIAGLAFVDRAKVIARLLAELEQAKTQLAETRTIID